MGTLSAAWDGLFRRVPAGVTAGGRDWNNMSMASSSHSLNTKQTNSYVVTLKDLLIWLVVFVSYFLSAHLDLKLVHLQNGEGIIWVPSGIALAAILLRGNRIIPVVFAASMMVELTSGQPALIAMAIAAGNTAECALGAYLVNRFAGGRKAFSRPANVLRFSILAGAVATLASATVGTTVTSAPIEISQADVLATLFAWWAGHALGVLILTPFLVLLLDGGHHPLHLSELLEIAALLIGLSLVCLISFGPVDIFSNRADTPLFLCVPFLVWVGIRFCPLEAAGACLVLSGFATWGSLHGYGPFAHSTSIPLPLVAYLCVATTMTLTGSATVARQRDVAEELLESLYRVESSKEIEIQRLLSEVDFYRDELIRRVHSKSRSGLDPQDSEVRASGSEVLWLLEAESECVRYVSPAYEEIWGRPREDLDRDVHAWLDAVIPEDRGYAIMFVGQDFPGDRTEATYRIRRPDGSLRWIFDRGFVIRDPTGRAIRYLGLASDITEMVRRGEFVPAQLEESSPLPPSQGRK